MGLPPQSAKGRDLAEVLEGELTDFLTRSGKKLLKDDEKLEDALKKITRQVSMEEIGKKPEVTVVISRLTAD